MLWRWLLQWQLLAEKHQRESHALRLPPSLGKHRQYEQTKRAYGLQDERRDGATATV